MNTFAIMSYDSCCEKYLVNYWPTICYCTNGGQFAVTCSWAGREKHKAFTVFSTWNAYQQTVVCFSIDISAFGTVDFNFHSVESDLQSVADVLMVGAVIFKWLKWVECVIYLFFCDIFFCRYRCQFMIKLFYNAKDACLNQKMYKQTCDFLCISSPHTFTSYATKQTTWFSCWYMLTWFRLERLEECVSADCCCHKHE